VTGLSSSQRLYLGMINRALAAHPKWSYLDPAWIMTIMYKESGYNPLAGPNGAGRFDGLMQVEPATAAQMASIYGIPAGPQTDPMTSILSGTATLDDYARGYIKAWNTTSLDLWILVKSYNGGLKNLLPNPNPPPTAQWLANVARYLADFQAQLPVIEEQMAATAKVMPHLAHWAPQRGRSVMPLLTENGR
jgi:soluble lytic murein transglycosylase-like protein